MGNWLNTYQKVTSLTGKPVTLFIDNAPLRDNPWIEIRGAGRRYRNNGKGGWEIQQISQSSGTWDPVNVIDEEYWTNYINDIDKKRKQTPAQNIFQKAFGIEGKLPEKACGGKVEKDQNGTILKRNFARYGDNGDFNEFMFSGNTPFGKVINEFIHPVYKDTTNTYTDRRGYNWSDGSDSDIGRYINNNDTIYWEGKYITDNNKFGVSPDQLKSKSKFVDLLRYNTTGAIYNQNDKNTLTRLRLENKKQHGGRLMRQGGKIIEVPFE